MKKISVFLTAFLLMAGFLAGQTDSLAMVKHDFKPYATVKAELLGLGMALSITPYDLISSNGRLSYLKWLPLSVEVGISNRLAIFAGLAGRYYSYTSPPGTTPDAYRSSRLFGVKMSLGIRGYLGRGNGQGFYLQPTGKLLIQGMRENNSYTNASNIEHDWMFTSRFGWQKRLWKGLTVDVAVGPGLGFRSVYHNYYNFSYFWNTDMGEIDNPSVDVAYVRNRFVQTNIFLIGDASLALGWRF